MDAERHITEVSRVGKYVKDKVQPARVKFNSHEGKTEILQRAKMHKDIQSFKRIFIAPDMTRQQLTVDKELRLSLKSFVKGMNLMPKLNLVKL